MKTGAIARLVHYVRIDGVNLNKGSVSCHDLERKMEFDVIGQSLVDSMDSADKFTKVEKVTKTKMVEIFDTVRENVFTVKFEKLDGSLRTIRGYMVKKETGMGRSMVIDLDLPNKPSGSYDTRLRQVDHRTIKELILNDVKYQVKK